MTASKRSMCRVRLSVPGVTRYGPINQNFVCSFVSSLLHIILILASFVAETRILAGMKIENRGKKKLLEKIDKHTFFPMKIQMIDL